jgi:spore protease
MDKRVMEADIEITEVNIETQKAANALGKPRGTYITIEAAQMIEEDTGYHREISKVLSRELKKFLPENYSNSKILIVGLGNRQVTPDALGPKVIDHLFITRHLIKEYGKYLLEFDKCCSVSGIVPGVMAQTGMESVEIMKGVVRETKPDVILVIDALAARSVKRLNRTIQITDTGIIPGSGVGNYRNAINQEHLGVPVIAIGIPTVVDAATIVADTFAAFAEQMEGREDAGEDMEEKIRQMISPKLNTMYVTPKDIDEAVERLSFTISEGLNMTFVPSDAATL